LKKPNGKPPKICSNARSRPKQKKCTRRRGKKGGLPCEKHEKGTKHDFRNPKSEKGKEKKGKSEENRMLEGSEQALKTRTSQLGKTMQAGARRKEKKGIRRSGSADDESTVGVEREKGATKHSK